MKKYHSIVAFPVMSLLFVTILLVAACASGGTSGSSSTGTGGAATSTVAPQATQAKTKPQTPVTVDQALCDRILSKAEVSKITQKTVVSVRVIASENGGSCNYETAPFKAALVITFFPNAGNILQGIQDQLKNAPNFQGTITPITGLGDAAVAIVNPLTATVIQYRVIATYGAVFMNCVLPNSDAGDTVAIDQLKQLTRLVIDRL